MYKFIFILFLIFSKAFAQGSDPVLRVDYAFGGIQNDVLLDLLETTEDFSLVMAGYTNSIVSAEVTQNSFGNEDFWIIKQNIEEEIVWTNRFGGSENDRAHKIIELADGYLIVGSSNSPTSGNKTSNHYGGQDVWMIKLNKNGGKVWERSYGGSGDDYGVTVITAPDGGFYIGAYSNSSISGNKSANHYGGMDYWLIKTNALGVKQWDASFGGTEDDILQDVLPNNGNIVMGGYSSSDVSGNKNKPTFGGEDFWLVEVNRAGNTIIDEYVFGGTENDRMARMAENIHNTGFFVAGTSESGIGGNKNSANRGGQDFWVMRLDDNRDKVWEINIGGNQQDILTDMIFGLDGAPIVGGTSNSLNSGNKNSGNIGGNDYWAVKIDTTGNVYWQKTYGGTENDSLTTLFVRCDRGLYLGGKSESGVSGTKTHPTRRADDYWVVTLDVRTKPFFNASDHCFGTALNFYDRSELYPEKWTWDFGDPLSGNNSSTDRNPVHTFSAPGDYNVTLKIKEGCQDDTTITRVITVFDNKILAKVDLGDDFYMCEGENAVLQNQKSVPSDARYLWSTGDTVPEIIVSEFGIYTLTIQSANCYESSTIEVENCPLIYVPNAFTPNKDGVNETWGAEGVGIREFELFIFNRWGEMIYTTQDFYAWWDGTYMNRNCQQDVYVYKIIYRGITGPQKELVGTVTLYR